jgi:hypothetical protein
MITPSEFQRYLQSILDTSRKDIKREVSDRWLLWEEAGHCLEAIEQPQSEIYPIPILIELHGLNGSVLAAIQEKLGWWLDLDEKTLKDLLRDRRLFVFLDGLNELPNEQAWQAVDQFRQVCVDLKVSLIITTRELGSGLIQGNVKKLEMLPLTEPQMKEFVYKQLPETGGELWRQIQGKLRELAETPLLLKMLCDVFEQNGEIPKSRGDLFRKEFARRYEEFKPERLRNVSEESRRFAFNLLSYLAFTMVKGERHTDPCKPSASWITISQTQAETIIANTVVEIPLETIAAIQSRCGFYNYEIYQQAQETDNLGFEDDLIRNLYKDIDKVISQIQENPELRQEDNEDRLTIDIVNQLRILEYNVSHETKIGGHADIVIRKNDFLWLGEAKIYRDNNNYLWEGFLQLTTRYSIGDYNQENGGLLIYIRQEDASSIMKNWQNYLLEKSLPDYSFRLCKMRSLAFISTHKHEKSGLLFHVRHIPVMLHFAPKDKNGRRKTKSP